MQLLNELNSHGYEAYVVGGAIRSYLLGLPIHDYDLTTNALPAQMKEVFHQYHTIDTGIEHGTVTVVIHHTPVEITTYRKDSAYLDHRHPDHVEFTPSLEEDCKRRDFTINAMCYHPKTGIIDFFQGQQDLANKKIRCIGEPEKRIEEDALRILRAIRFAARLSFSITPSTARVLFAKKDTLQYVSIERIAEEFNGTLESVGCSTTLEDYRSIIEVFLPELKQYSDRDYQKMLQEIEDETTLHAAIRMAILLSYLPDTKQAKSILKRMKYSNAFIDTVTDLLNHSNDTIDTDIEFRTVLSTMHVDIDTYFAYWKAKHHGVSLVEKRQQYAKLTNDAYCWNLSQLEINGKDLLACGIKGKAIGETLHRLLDDVIHERCENQHEILLKHVKSED